jgi:hypothetical protein
MSSEDIGRWREAASSGDVSELEGYISEFPNGLFVPFARERIALIKKAEVASRASADATEIVAKEDTPTLVAALDILGFTQQTRGLIPATAQLELAFEEWRASQPNPSGATPEDLYRDAARLSMFLAASTAQSIRTDLKALESIEKHLELAEGDLATLRRLAETNEEAKAILSEAETDVAAVITAREKVSARLDESVAYYHSMVDRAKEYFAPQTSLDLLSRQADTRGTPIPLQDRLYADAELFVNQVKAAQTRAPGSYAWLAHFVPET